MLKPNQQEVGLVQNFANARCYGLSFYENELIYLDVVATATAATAIFATLQSGKQLSINVDLRTKTVFKGDKPETRDWVRQMTFWTDKGMLVKYMNRIPEINMVHMLVINKKTEPEKYQLGVVQRYYMLNIDSANTVNILGQRISEMVSCAVFAEWFRFLAKNGIEKNYVKKAECYGGIQAYAISTAKKDWEDMISRGLEKKYISLPTGVFNAS